MKLPLSSFPTSVRAVSDPIFEAVAVGCKHETIGTFTAVVGSEKLEIPDRVYFDERNLARYAKPITPENVVANCIFSRHHDGFVRQRCIEELIRISEPWVLPFIVQPIGEYVIEILRVILDRVDELDKREIALYLSANPKHWTLTQARVTSYWNCYYRFTPRQDYPGFKLIDLFNSIAAENMA